jgi:hypothetical protein
MPSQYSNLKIQLMQTGENNTTWGNVTNVNLGTAIEEAIVGTSDPISFSNADVTLTLTDTNGPQNARNMRLILTGTATAGYNLVLGAGCQIEKPYIVNNGTDGTITVKNTTGTGIAVPAGKTMWVYNNGTNVVDVVTHLSSVTLGSALPVASGGTGVTTSTGTGSVVLSASPSFTGTVNFGPAIVTGSGVSTGDAQLELGGNRSGDGPAYMDLHAVAGGDFSARVFRGPGANGNMEIVNTGIGVLSIATNATEKMRIDSSGNVMVGTTSATGLFSVAGVSYGQMIATDRFGVLGNNLYYGTGNFRYIGNGHAYGWTQANTDGADYRLLYAGNNTSGAGAVATTSERIYIASDGRLGIGTTSLVAGRIMTVNGSPTFISAGSTFNIDLDGSSGANGVGLEASFASGGYGPLRFRTGGAETMRIASNGFVGVGTSTDNGVDKLTVAGIVGSYVSGRAGFHLYNGGATAEWFIGQPSAASHNLTFSKLVSSTYTDYVAIDSSGNVGIGNTSPTVTLDVTGGIKTSRTAVTSPATSDGNIFSGTYTPTLTNVANIDIPASTAYTFQYMRVGNVVTVSGKIDVTVTGTGLTRLNVSLPISSNFSAEENCAGTAVMTASSVSINIPASIRADATNDVAQVQYHGNLTGMAQAYFLTFTYRII